MKSFKKALVALWKEEDGLETVEYAIAGGLIAAVVVAAFTDLGKAVGDVINYLYTVVDTAYTNATGTGGTAG